MPIVIISKLKITRRWFAIYSLEFLNAILLANWKAIAHQNVFMVNTDTSNEIRIPIRSRFWEWHHKFEQQKLSSGKGEKGHNRLSRFNRFKRQSKTNIMMWKLLQMWERSTLHSQLGFVAVNSSKSESYTKVYFNLYWLFFPATIDSYRWSFLKTSAFLMHLVWCHGNDGSALC